MIEEKREKEMQKRVRSIAIVLAAMLIPGLAWAVDYDIADTANPVPDEIVVAADGSLVDSGATAGTSEEAPKSLTGVTIEANQTFIIGDNAAGWIAGTNTPGLKPVYANVDTLSMANGSTLGLTDLATVTVGKAFELAEGTLALRDAASIMFNEGMTVTDNGTITMNGGGSVLNGEGQEILLTVVDAITFDGNDGSGAAVVNSKFNLGDIAVDAGTGVSVLAYDNFAAGAIGDITLNTLNIRSGVVNAGAEFTNFKVLCDTIIGGNFDETNKTYGVAQLNIDADSPVVFEGDLSVLANGGIYGQDATSGSTTAVPTVQLGGNLIMAGSDKGDVDVSHWAVIESNPANNQPLTFQKNVADSASAVNLGGAFNVLKGTINFGEDVNGLMDMNVDMLSDGWLWEEYGYDGITMIGSNDAATDDWETTVTVGNYTQKNGMVVGANTALAQQFEWEGLVNVNTLTNASIVINGTTTIAGGTFAVDAFVAGDINIIGSSQRHADVAVLGGWGNHITNTTADALTMTVGHNGMIHAAAGLAINGIDTMVNSQGAVLFDGAPIAIDKGTRDAVSFTVANSDSIQFGQAFLRFADENPIDLVNGGADVDVKLPEFAFNGLFGTVRTHFDDVANAYSVTREAVDNLDFSGTSADFAVGSRILDTMYGNKTNSGLNSMIYRSIIWEDPATPGVQYGWLLPKDDASRSEYASYLMNQANLENFASGRYGNGDASPINMYNGNVMNGVNMVAQAVARSHIQSSMKRSDFIRRVNAIADSGIAGGEAFANAILACPANRIWAGGFGLWEDADERDGLAGYKYKSYGAIIGYDAVIGQNFILGGSFAYNRGDFEDKAAISHDSTIDNYSFNIYGTYSHQSGFFGTLFAGYTYSDNDIAETYRNLNRNDRSAHDNNTKTWIGGAKIGYDWKPAPCFSITPSIGFTALSARTSGHTAMLAGAALGAMSKVKDEAYYLPVEVTFGYQVHLSDASRFDLDLNLGYAYNFDEDGASGSMALAGFQNGVPYGIQSREQGHHLLHAGVGGTYTRGTFSIGVKYDYVGQRKADAHQVMGTVGFSF